MPLVGNKIQLLGKTIKWGRRDGKGKREAGKGRGKGKREVKEKRIGAVRKRGGWGKKSSY